MKVTGFSIESREIEIEQEVYEQAKRDDRLEDELDSYLSDMNGVTFVVEPDGAPVDLYENGSAARLGKLAELLDVIPTLVLVPYILRRQAAEIEQAVKIEQAAKPVPE